VVAQVARHISPSTHNAPSACARVDGNYQQDPKRRKGTSFHHHISTAITNPRPLLRHDTESPTAPGTHRVGSCPQGAVRRLQQKNRPANAIGLCGLVVAPPCPKRCKSAHREFQRQFPRPVSPIPQIDDSIELIELENHARTNPLWMQLWQLPFLQLWVSRRMRREGTGKGLFISPHSSLRQPWRFAETFPMTLLIVRSAPHVAISVGDGARDRLRCRRLSASACFLSRSRGAGGVCMAIWEW
jgi:hypothetical protein